MSDRPTPDPSSSDAPAPGAGDGDSPLTLGSAAARRRRGSRGGRNRRKPNRPEGGAGEQGTNGGPSDVELPDPPGEGVPSIEAAERALVGRPRIGDTRPAPAPTTPAADATAPRGQGQPKGRGQGQGQGQGQGRGQGNGSGNGQRRGGTPRAERSADQTTTDGPTGDDAAGGSAAGEGNAPGGARRRRGGRGRGGSDRPAKGGEPMEHVLHDAETLEKRRGKERKGRPVGRYLMCVHTREKATQLAVLEGRSLIEHYVSRPADSATQIDGNIYVGRVQNVLPGMEAAFVDIGTPKNAVLYRGDVQFDAGDVDGGGKKKNDVRIEQVLRNGQLVVCQVTKNPIGAKGARLTQEVSIPGRFVVLIPNSDTYGISKRLADDERKRLRRILDEVRPAGHGLIVRTAAEGATAEELQRDVAMLLRQWEAIDAKAKKVKGPALLYKEPDMAVRVIREEFNRNYRGVIIDDPEIHREVREYVESITPELADRVELYDAAAEGLPLFEKHHVHEQLHKAIDRKVWLPSGGSLIIERTEALTVIDVNTGKNVGSSSLEETVFRNNLEAADEIARQLRLRDIGGIIVIDFIDMETKANREAVIAAFRDALARDKTRTQVFDISELGLVEMTRKRISEGLVESLSDTCPECSGRGLVFDDDLLRE